MKRYHLVALAVAVWSALVARAAPAPLRQTINVQLDGNGPTYSGLAAAPDAGGGTNWNSLDSAVSPVSSGNAAGIPDLINSAGQPTGLGFTITYGNHGDQQGYGPIEGPDALLASTYYFNNNPANAPTTIAFTNLPAGASCDLYLYGYCPSRNNSVSATVGTNTVIAAGHLNNGYAPYSTNNQGYVWNVITNISPDASHRITAAIGSPNYGWAALNGFQLVVRGRP